MVTHTTYYFRETPTFAKVHAGELDQKKPWMGEKQQPRKKKRTEQTRLVKFNGYELGEGGCAQCHP